VDITRDLPPRERLIDTADRLFYRDGIRAVGIDRIIAEAGVAKATLYTHFPSKDDLIVAVLRHREERVLAFFATPTAQHGRRRKEPLRAFFDALKTWFESPGFRGCAFQNAAVELADPSHAGTRLVRDHKRRFADIIRRVVDDAVGRSAPAVAAAIVLLVEGAIMTAVVQGTSEAADVARRTAETLVAQARS